MEVINHSIKIFNEIEDYFNHLLIKKEKILLKFL